MQDVRIKKINFDREVSSFREGLSPAFRKVFGRQFSGHEGQSGDYLQRVKIKMLNLFLNLGDV